MPHDPDPRMKISRSFFNACYYAYHEQGHLLNGDESNILLYIIRTFPRHVRISRLSYYAAKDVIKAIHERS